MRIARPLRRATSGWVDSRNLVVDVEGGVHLATRWAAVTPAEAGSEPVQVMRSWRGTVTAAIAHEPQRRWVTGAGRRQTTLPVTTLVIAGKAAPSRDGVARMPEAWCESPVLDTSAPLADEWARIARVRDQLSNEQHRTLLRTFIAAAAGDPLEARARVALARSLDDDTDWLMTDAHFAENDDAPREQIESFLASARAAAQQVIDTAAPATAAADAEVAAQAQALVQSSRAVIATRLHYRSGVPLID